MNYARVIDGLVVELFTSPEGFALSDCFVAEIAAQFAPVPDGVAPAQGWRYDGSTFAPSQPPAPTLAQQAKAMLDVGIRIVSTATPALNGTYPCDESTGNQDGNTLAAINAGLTFPGGVIIRLDVDVTAHVFSIADFKNLCQAKLNFQQALNTIIGSNAGVLPEQPATIA